jgi:hypothetical protein
VCYVHSSLAITLFVHDNMGPRMEACRDDFEFRVSISYYQVGLADSGGSVLCGL